MPIDRRTQRHVLDDPRSGHVLTVPAGSRLHVRFRRTLHGWHVQDRPGHLVPLEIGTHGFEFLVFRGPDTATGTRPLRLVRGDRGGPAEVRDLTVVTTS